MQSYETNHINIIWAYEKVESYTVKQHSPLLVSRIKNGESIVTLNEETNK